MLQHSLALCKQLLSPTVTSVVKLPLLLLQLEFYDYVG